MFNAATLGFHAIEDLLVDGDKVVGHVPAYGTHQGESIGVPTTNKNGMAKARLRTHSQSRIQATVSVDRKAVRNIQQMPFRTEQLPSRGDGYAASAAGAAVAAALIPHRSNRTVPCRGA